MPRWVLEEIIKYLSLVHQLHIVGNTSRNLDTANFCDPLAMIQPHIYQTEQWTASDMVCNISKDFNTISDKISWQVVFEHFF